YILPFYIFSASSGLVHFVHEVFEHLIGVFTLDLAGRRRVAFLWIEFFGNETEIFNLLGPREMSVGSLYFLLEELRHRRMRDQRTEPRLLNVIRPRPLRQGIEVDL